jgi:hypothetical protein
MGKTYQELGSSAIGSLAMQVHVVQVEKACGGNHLSVF